MPKASELVEAIEKTIKTYGDYEVDFSLRLDQYREIVLEARVAISEFYSHLVKPSGGKVRGHEAEIDTSHDPD